VAGLATRACLFQSQATFQRHGSWRSSRQGTSTGPICPMPMDGPLGWPTSSESSAACAHFPHGTDEWRSTRPENGLPSPRTELSSNLREDAGLGSYETNRASAAECAPGSRRQHRLCSTGSSGNAPPTGGYPGKGVVRTKRVVGLKGKVTMVATLDADSKSFGEDLRRVFERKVRKARRENKRVTGLADFVPTKR